MSGAAIASRTVVDAGREVLVVDDDSAMRLALETNFQWRGWHVETAVNKSEAMTRFRQRRHALVVCDVRMPGGDGFEVMRAVREFSGPPATGVILLTAFATVPGAVSAMKAGACEYLTKPVAFEHLLEAAERVLRTTIRKAHTNKERNWEMIGSAPALLLALERARKAAESDADVLIQAENGTGKELLARRIHSLSKRCDGPFVAVNCAGLPESLLESELFGHARGAFTGAVTAQVGKFEMAAGGTLLLDEIGELPLNLQPKLLRALQEREFYRLGERGPVKVDIRVLATTNRDLARMVREGTFRADLYYRLNVVPLTLPPLRQRREDIRELAIHFARRYSRGESKHVLSEDLLAQLDRRAWPGNVRELANVIRRFLAFEASSFEFEDGNDFFESQPLEAAQLLPGQVPILSMQPPIQPGMSLLRMERQLFAMTLEATAGNRSLAATMLGVSVRTVRNKIREYNLPSRGKYVRLHD